MSRSITHWAVLGRSLVVQSTEDGPVSFTFYEKYERDWFTDITEIVASSMLDQ